MSNSIDKSPLKPADFLKNTYNLMGSAGGVIAPLL